VWKVTVQCISGLFGTLDQVIARAGATYSVHGEVRAPLNHFLNRSSPTPEGHWPVNPAVSQS
jgi:hypothetical protein